MGREGSAHELPVKESLRSRARSAPFGFLIFRPVHSGLKLYTLSSRDRHTHGHTHSRDLCVSVCLDRSHEYYVLQQQKRAQAGERGDRDSLFITPAPARAARILQSRPMTPSAKKGAASLTRIAVSILEYGLRTRYSISYLEWCRTRGDVCGEVLILVHHPGGVSALNERLRRCPGGWRSTAGGVGSFIRTLLLLVTQLTPLSCTAHCVRRVTATLHEGLRVPLEKRRRVLHEGLRKGRWRRPGSWRNAGGGVDSAG